jgi:hypothetical protein
VEDEILNKVLWNIWDFCFQWLTGEGLVDKEIDLLQNISCILPFFHSSISSFFLHSPFLPSFIHSLILKILVYRKQQLNSVTLQREMTRRR